MPAALHTALETKPTQAGDLPTLDVILHWFATHPSCAPMWSQQNQADYLYDSSGLRAIGCYCRSPHGGSVNVYASGKVVVQGPPRARPWLLQLVLAWVQARQVQPQPRPAAARRNGGNTNRGHPYGGPR